MTAHVIYPAWDEKQPATFSPTILIDVLRKSLGFEGLVMSDDLEMKAIQDKPESIPLLGTNAGIDLFLICHDLEKVNILQNAMIQDIERGLIQQSTIDQSLARIFKVKKRLRTSENTDLDLEGILQENHKLAQEMREYFRE